MRKMIKTQHFAKQGVPELAPPMPLRHTRFDNAALDAVGVEWMALSDLQRRVPPAQMRVPERLDFYLLLLVTAGSGWHTVDFARAPLRAGAVVWVRPGQVQQWQVGSTLEGALVLIAAHALAPAYSRPDKGVAPHVTPHWAVHEWPSVALLRDPAALEMQGAMAQLEHDFKRFDGSAMDAALIRHSAQGLVLRLARWFAASDQGRGAQPAERAIYRLFLGALETGFRERLGVGDFARRLGYSESTLSRACQRAEGRSAKEVVDRRVALEAARELAHSPASVADIGYRLGFSETTNFVKFFRRMHGVSPLAFKRSMALQA